MKSIDQFTLEELCSLSDVSRRTLRYYIQQGLVDRPVGMGRGAYYTYEHLERLLEIKKWKKAGVSLNRIQELLKMPSRAEVPIPRPKPGDVDVWTRIFLGEGIELNIEPSKSGLSPEQVRMLARRIGDVLDEVVGSKNR